MTGQVEITELQTKLAALPAAMPRARAHLLAELATAYAHAGLPNEGLEAVREALHLTQPETRSYERAEVMCAAALCHYFRNDFMMAIAGGLDAYQGFSRNSDFANMGHALTTIAAACKDIGATELAIDALNGCLNIARRLGDAFLEARSSNALGMLLGEVGKFDEAARHLALARECLERAGKMVHLPKVVASVGDLLKYQAAQARAAGDAAASTRFLQQAIDARHEVDASIATERNLFDQADNACALGEYYFLLENYASARAHLQQALTLGQLLKHAQILIESNLYLGRILLATGDAAAAERNLRQSLELARAEESRKMQIEAHRQLATCLLVLERPHDASTQSMLADELESNIRAVHHEAAREARQLWQHYFSRHPLIAPVA